MLRLNSHIKLSDKEVDNLRLMTGRADIPKTVQAHNQQLDQAAAAWETVDCAEAKLLAAVAIEMKIPE